MFWPHTKKLVPAEAGYEFFVEMPKLPFAEHKITFTTNSVPCIITPPLFGKRQKFCLLNDLKATDARPFDPSATLRAGSAQEQASLLSFIPNQPLSRQGKSLEAISTIFLPLALSFVEVSKGWVLLKLFILLSILGWCGCLFSRFDCN